MDRSAGAFGIRSPAGEAASARHLRYRPDIDGLRALAVVPIVLFHAGVPGFSGGFVGVDIFFVISGYLIATNIARDLDAGRFSLVDFYERRIRRIVPALAAMLVATTLAAWLVLVSEDLVRFSRSLIATVGFGSNIYFFRATDYFDLDSATRPLLHTWSLAVEEQFYLVFPLLMAALVHWRRRVTIVVLALIGLASLALSIGLSQRYAHALFFLPFGRLWEFLIGALLALIPLASAAAPRGGRSLSAGVGWLGIALIVFAVGWFDEAIPFPGSAALVPCLGAALVIGAGGGSAARLLGLWPLRSIGRISYSLYLWHWPILVFYRYVHGPDLAAADIAVLLLLTLAVSWLSWRFVEMPWRRPPARWTRRRVFRASAAMAVMLVAIGAVLPVADAHLERLPTAVSRLARGSRDVNPSRRACNRPLIARIDRGDVCRIGIGGATPEFAVIGDSIADALMPGFDAAAIRNGTAGLAITFTGCRPLIGAVAEDTTCEPAYAATFRLLQRGPAIHDIVLVGRWATIFGDTAVTGVAADAASLVDAASPAPSTAENRRVFARSMQRLADGLPGRRIWLVAFVPEQFINVPRVLAMQALRGAPLQSGISRQAHDARSAVGRGDIEAVVAAHGFGLIDMTDQACTAASCPILDRDGHPLYSDDHHPTRTAVLLWSGAFDAPTRPQAPR